MLDTDRSLELKNCTFVKTVLMVLVVLYHCCVFWTGNWFSKNPLITSQEIGMFSQWLNSFHIYSFFFVSGYLFSYGKFEAGKYDSLIRFCTTKIKRLLIPYCFVLFVWVIPWAVIVNGYSFHDVIVRHLLGDNPNQLWFLLVLFWVQIIGFLLIPSLKKSNRLVMVIFFLTYVSGNYLESHFLNFLQIFSAIRCFAFFGFGCFFRESNSFRTNAYKINSLVYVVLDVILFFIYRHGLYNGWNSILVSAIEFLLRMFGAIMGFIVLQRIAKVVEWDKRKVLGVLANYSMPIYLFHQQLVYLLIILLNGKINPYMHVIINFIVVFFASLLISVIMSKFRTTRFLIGEKN